MDLTTPGPIITLIEQLMREFRAVHREADRNGYEITDI
jgi:hypothetical protein